MNKQELQRKRNDNARCLEHSSVITTDTVRFNVGNTLKHELAKFLLCWELKNMGYSFVTEAEFTGKRRRPDIYVLDTGEIIEIELDIMAIKEKRKGDVTYYTPEKVFKKFGLTVGV